MTNTQNSIITSLNYPTTQRALVLLFVICTTILFIFLNKIQPNYYIDEAFHIPQTQRFCNGTFFEVKKLLTNFLIKIPFNIYHNIFYLFSVG